MSAADHEQPDELLFPCRWGHCADVFVSIDELVLHLDQHALTAPLVRLGGRKRRKMAEKGMWMYFPYLSQAGNTTTTNTTSDFDTSHSHPLPPSFQSLPEPPTFPSPPSSNDSPVAPSPPTLMPVLSQDTRHAATDPSAEPSRIKGVFPFAAHSPYAQDIVLGHVQTSSKPRSDQKDTSPPPNSQARPSAAAFPTTADNADELKRKQQAWLLDLGIYDPALNSGKGPFRRKEGGEGVVADKTTAPDVPAGSQSPFLPPTQPFGDIPLFSSTPIDLITAASTSLHEEGETSMMMEVELPRKDVTGLEAMKKQGMEDLPRDALTEEEKTTSKERDGVLDLDDAHLLASSLLDFAGVCGDGASDGTAIDHTKIDQPEESHRQSAPSPPHEPPSVYSTPQSSVPKSPSAEAKFTLDLVSRPLPHEMVPGVTSVESTSARTPASTAMPNAKRAPSFILPIAFGSASASASAETKTTVYHGFGIQRTES